MYAKLLNSNVDYEYSNEKTFVDNLEYVATLILYPVDSYHVGLNVSLNGELLIQKWLPKEFIPVMTPICGIGLLVDGGAGQAQFDNVLLTSSESVARARMSVILERQKLVLQEMERKAKEKEKQAQLEKDKQMELVREKEKQRLAQIEQENKRQAQLARDKEREAQFERQKLKLEQLAREQEKQNQLNRSTKKKNTLSSTLRFHNIRRILSQGFRI